MATKADIVNDALHKAGHVPYGDGYTHEFMHLTGFLMDSVEGYLIETRCADEFPDVKEAAQKAHQALFDLYQIVGSKMS